MPTYPRTFQELNDYLDTEVSPEAARRALAAIFVCLYGTKADDGSISFALEKDWDTFVLCEVDDELKTIALLCKQLNRDEG